MIVKLTDQDGYTRRDSTGETLWRIGEWHEAKPGDDTLCTDKWIHCYAHPLLAVLHNPAHANIENPRMWECEVDGDVKHDGLMKSGTKRLRVIKEIIVPVVTNDQRIAYAIYCAMSVYGDPDWIKWADGWLSGEDRSANAAYAAYAAYAAAYAAYAAAYTAYAAYAANAAYAAYAASNADLLLCALVACDYDEGAA